MSTLLRFCRVAISSAPKVISAIRIITIVVQELRAARKKK